MFSIIRTAIVSFIILIIVSFAVLILNASVLNKKSNKEVQLLTNYFAIAMPNAYVGSIQSDDRIMSGEIDYVRYRFLGDKPITDGSYKKSYTYMPLINGIYGDNDDYLFYQSGDSETDLDKVSKYNKAGKELMKFYHPSMKYNSYENDLENIDDISSDKVMEISLSFDKAYSIDEVKNMIPSDVTLNWYWVDTFTENDEKISSESALNEYYVRGIKALSNQGEAINSPEEDFISAINTGQKHNFSNEYNKIYDLLSNGKGEINKSDLKIIGVVVSGDTKSLNTLKDKSYIKAATIGAIEDKY